MFQDRVSASNEGRVTAAGTPVMHHVSDLPGGDVNKSAQIVSGFASSSVVQLDEQGTCSLQGWPLPDVHSVVLHPPCLCAYACPTEIRCKGWP